MIIRQRGPTLGLDLSFKGAGAVILPMDWDGRDWSALPRATFEGPLHNDSSEKLKIVRLIEFGQAIVNFGRNYGVAAVGIEGYAFSSQRSRAHSLGELGGVIRHEVFRRMKLVPTTVGVSEGRKHLMGKVPKQNQKNETRFFLNELEMPAEWTMDEGDAFVVANFVSGVRGGFSFVTAPPPKERKRRR